MTNKVILENDSSLTPPSHQEVMESGRLDCASDIMIEV